jgi:16S rRNA (adenine(1408)-N(1))-methyltransferase
VAVPFDNSREKPSLNSLPPTGEGIVLDIGTGDGLFVYQCAKENPRKFFIGIDANTRPLEKISEKIHRKPEKGGLSNVLFLQAAIEDLPAELNGVADEVHVHFPWGSLLRALVSGDQLVLANLRRICAPGALLEIVTGLDNERDASELARLDIPDLTPAHVESVLLRLYRRAGFAITEYGEEPPSLWSKLHTTWAKRLRDGPNRRLMYVMARAENEVIDNR